MLVSSLWGWLLSQLDGMEDPTAIGQDITGINRLKKEATFLLYSTRTYGRSNRSTLPSFMSLVFLIGLNFVAIAVELLLG